MTLTPLPTGGLNGLLARVADVQPELVTHVIDGGAGIGDTIQPMLNAHPGVHVTAYEPLPENVAVLRERFADNPRVTVRPVAIADHRGDARFEVPSRVEAKSGAWTSGTSYNGHLERTGLVGNARRVARDIRKRLRRMPVDVMTVPTVRLDEDLPAAPDVVKLDLQGAEPAALTGLGTWLADVKVFQVELQLLNTRDTHVFDVLTTAGFTPYLADLQFSAANLTPAIRERLREYGVVIEKEFAGSAFDAHTLVLGSWVGGATLPVRGQGLTPDFVRLLQEAKVSYFQTDVVALSDRVAWDGVLASSPSPQERERGSNRWRR